MSTADGIDWESPEPPEPAGTNTVRTVAVVVTVLMGAALVAMLGVVTVFFVLGSAESEIDPCFYGPGARDVKVGETVRTTIPSGDSPLMEFDRRLWAPVDPQGVPAPEGAPPGSHVSGTLRLESEDVLVFHPDHAGSPPTAFLERNVACL